METFILKVYRINKGTTKLVGTLQHINSEQQFSFTTQKELCTLLAGLVTTEEDDSEAEDPDAARSRASDTAADKEDTVIR